MGAGSKKREARAGCGGWFRAYHRMHIAWEMLLHSQTALLHKTRELIPSSCSCLFNFASERSNPETLEAIRYKPHALLKTMNPKPPKKLQQP